MAIYSTAKTFKKHTSLHPAVTIKDRCESLFMSNNVYCSIRWKNYKEANTFNN